MSDGNRKWKGRIIFNLKVFLPPSLRFCFYFGDQSFQSFPLLSASSSHRKSPFAFIIVLNQLWSCLGLFLWVFFPNFNTWHTLYLSVKECGLSDDEACVLQQKKHFPNNQYIMALAIQHSVYKLWIPFLVSLLSGPCSLPHTLKPWTHPVFDFRLSLILVPHSFKAHWEILGATVGIWQIQNRITWACPSCNSNTWPTLQLCDGLKQSSC